MFFNPLGDVGDQMYNRRRYFKNHSRPFTQKIEIKNVTEIKSRDFRKAGSRKRTQKLSLFYNNGKKLELTPIDQEGFLKAIKKINSKIKLNLGKEIT